MDVPYFVPYFPKTNQFLEVGDFLLHALDGELAVGVDWDFSQSELRTENKSKDSY